MDYLVTGRSVIQLILRLSLDHSIAFTETYCVHGIKLSIKIKILIINIRKMNSEVMFNAYM